ncbi:MAG: acyl-CoA dehydrogenase family protein, partial [Candidatus Methylomirabilales bacterium]
MDFELTETERLFQEMARDFAAKEVAPYAERTDQEGRFP